MGPTRSNSAFLQVCQNVCELDKVSTCTAPNDINLQIRDLDNTDDINTFIDFASAFHSDEHLCYQSS